MTKQHDNCSMLPLAASAFGHVVLCINCGVVTLTVQSLSIRFELTSFDQLAVMIAEARAVLVRTAELRSKASAPAAIDHLAAPDGGQRH